MATLSHKNSRGMIQFFDKGGKRRTLRLGRIERKTAEVVRSHVEHLVAYLVAKHPIPRSTAAWIEDQDEKLSAKLAKFGLIVSREPEAAVELKPFIDGYIAARTDLKPRTIKNFEQVRRWLVKHFGAKRDLATITRGEMGDWHRLLKKHLAPASVAMHVKKARQLFGDAVDRKMIADNPARKIKAGSMANQDRLEYVSAEMIEAVINSCPDAEWRLIFALARYGGLRVPSETELLRWDDVRWDTGRILVRSPKTAHYEGRAIRPVPIFPELQPYLRDAMDLAEPGAKHVISRHRGENLRTMAEKIIRRAGLEPWGKPFQNLRSSRETDLAERYPIHVVCAWIGNTEAVARRHYLQVTESHFKSAAESAAEGSGKDRKDTEHKTQKAPENPQLLHVSTTPKGNRTRGEIARKSHSSSGSAAKCAAPTTVSTHSVPVDSGGQAGGIQQIDLRRSSIHKGIIVHVGDEVAPRQARRRVRRALRNIGAVTGQPVHVIAKRLRGRKGVRR